ncbi:MAG: RluA family pseudouridine synthase [Candidatus Nomurabacteria bacterium]|nr:RluA family pseudouridine synthase [Candidatus Nomurabacteria bacterium]USN88247.1 MAG: RluA family pseudouridine synthase [Candidatus Nomurabacteria bacterium]
MPSEKEESVAKTKLVPEIIYEDDEVLVINKPYGLLVHEDWQSGPEGTVVDWFLSQVPGAKGVGEETLKPDGSKLERSGIVHRLDRETSGVMILAKTQKAHAFLKAQFHDRLAKKEYRAFVYGRIHDKWGTINRPIGRSAKDFKKRSAERGAKGVLREAITHFERIGVGEYKDEAFSYLKLMPQTGRTHQLRVHLKAIDRPIVGDKLYADKKITVSNNLELDRLALHAHILDIVLPNEERQRFIAPIPPEFEIAAEHIAE